LKNICPVQFLQILTMVLQDLGRRINAAVSNLTREQNLDEKVRRPLL
jgi:hypothetical protein